MTTGANKGYIEFLSEPTSSPDSAKILSHSYAMLSSTSWSVSDLDNRISTSKDFVNRAYTTASRTSSGLGDLGGMDSMQAVGAEEDLMSGQSVQGLDIWEE